MYSFIYNVPVSMFLMFKNKGQPSGVVFIYSDGNIFMGRNNWTLQK